MAKFRGSMACDSCSVAFDGDPINLIGNAKTIEGLSPDKQRELREFWLCSDCSVEYPRGAEDLFTADYFVVVPLCGGGCGDEVESEGWFCDYCDSLEEED